ncbi:hypothetical protein DVH24_030241 [Malus domestica]|uniref:RING-type domain-containing protein n=1 Tax=Malus domestica TaxID=3750 RepID=A0A498HXI0_MALDO|nr:hypothetical protein DVH24_030241 [Malus domestica]
MAISRIPEAAPNLASSPTYQPHACNPNPKLNLPGGLRCRTTATSTATNIPIFLLPNNPKLQCNVSSATTTPQKTTSYSPRLLFQFQRSNPLSPKCPSSFSLLRSTLRLSKSRCRICLQTVKSGQGTAIFTTKCSHSFHFACISAHAKKNSLILCPVCSTAWKELSDVKTKPLRVYNDDEPLLSLTSGSQFNPIPEENDDENDAVEFQGFFVNASSRPQSRFPSADRHVKNVEVSLSPELAVVPVGMSYETHAVVLKLKTPQTNESKTASLELRAPIDLVTVVDVNVSTSNARIQMMKRTMRLVAYSSTSKRLLPLRRMTFVGRRSARRIMDALCALGQRICLNDALKKAAKVIQDRREKNAVASIILLLNAAQPKTNQKRSSSPIVSSTRFSHLDIPVHTVAVGDGCHNALVKCVGGLLSVVVQDLNQASWSRIFVSNSASFWIAAIYSLTSGPAALGSVSIRLGDFYAGEERELLVELKMSFSAMAGPHASQNVISVRSTHRVSSSNEFVCSKERVLLLPRSQTVRSSPLNSNIERLKNLHVVARAVAESRRFMERSSDFSSAYHLLSSARTLLLHSSSASVEEFLRGLEGEMAELQRRRQVQLLAKVEAKQSKKRFNNGQVEDKQEPLTPTLAWRAAEKLAKVATLRKSMNRVSDLHGFENARF